MTKKSLIFLWLILSLGIYLRLTKFINTFSLDTDQVQPFILAGKIINSRRILLLGYGPDRINFMTPLYHYLVTFIYFFFLISLMYVSTYLVLPAYLYLLIRHLKLFRRNQKLITMAGLILLTVIFHTTVIQYHIKTNFRELASITSNSGSMNLLANPGKLIKSSTYNFFLINQGFISDGNNFSANILI